MRLFNLSGLFVPLFVFCIAVASPLKAETLIFGLDNVFSGTATPVGSAPWVTAKVDSIAGQSNQLNLTFSVAGLSGASQFVGSIYMNFQSASQTAADLSFARIVGTGGSADTPSISQSATQSFKADGQGRFNLEFDFESAMAKRFNAGTADMSFLVSGISALSVNDFLFYSAGGSIPLYIAAHIQGIPKSQRGGTDSVWIGGHPINAPEPATYLALGGFLGITAWLMGRRARVRGKVRC